MPDRSIPIHLASVEQLVEELGRRLNEPKPREAPEEWCDSCQHFKFDLPGVPGNDRRNPCMRKHRMDFYVPQPHDSPETFGYFRLVCPDRTQRE